MTPDSIKRYARHLVLKEIGGPGQRALLGSKLAIVGAGGLGGPAALYLAAAGVGSLTIIDDDVVEISNLQRQIQFQNRDTGSAKAEALATSLMAINPDIKARPINQRLTKDNAKTLLGGHHIILDGTDSFETRFAVNNACLDLGLPLVSGALGRFDGQMAVFMSNGKGPCYRCLVPEIPPHAATCSEVGIVGALAGIVGSMMALEAIKLITKAGNSLSGRLWIYDGLQAESRTVKLARDPQCPACS